MRPSTPHYTSPRDLIEQSRIQTGVKKRGGAFHGAIAAFIVETAAILVVVGLWFIFHR